MSLNSCATAPVSPPTAPLWSEVMGHGEPTVVFIHGNGNATSADWRPVAPRVAEWGVRTMVYDRAGHGQSDFFSSPYRITDEVEVLNKTLTVKGIEGPIVLVAHSYGGAIAQLLAARLDDIVGVVFVDALIPGTLTADVAQGQIDQYSPQFDQLRAQAPGLAKAVIPPIEALPATASTLSHIMYPDGMPTVVITAETSDWLRPQDVAHSKAIVEGFVKSSPFRREIIAAGIDHQVMKHRPDVILTAIEWIIEASQE